jgi:2-oxoglutarate ferredoxin oxidoreductase subunit alpha
LVKIIRDKYFIDAKAFNRIMGSPIAKHELVAEIEKLF